MPCKKATTIRVIQWCCSALGLAFPRILRIVGFRAFGIERGTAHGMITSSFSRESRQHLDEVSVAFPEGNETALRIPVHIDHFHQGKLTDHTHRFRWNHECIILAVRNSETPEKAVYQSLFRRQAYLDENRPCAGVGLRNDFPDFPF